MVYSSPHLEEIFEVAGQVSILRDGEAVAWGDVEDDNLNWLFQKLVGRP